MPPRVTPPQKSIFDPVHGQIELEGVALALVASREFQRLWGIHQTGFAHLVFPGANHTRLEHSLGTYWVAREMGRHLDLDAASAELAMVGGLLHDLGHPPFSHTLEPSMREVLGHGHEAASRTRIVGAEVPGVEEDPEAFTVPRILEKHGLRPKDVADLVDPPRHRERHGLLRSMLHSAVDADRIDYLQRDAHYTGVAHGAIDAVRLLDTIRAHRDRIAFAEKGRMAVEGFLVGRALMYAAVYYHKTVRAAELMAQAAIERSVGYPESARSLFSWTDGELLTRLPDRGDLTARLVQGLLERRLYKRAYRWTELDAAMTRSWARILHSPTERRQLEDAFAERLRAPPGSVLFDLAGLEPRGRPLDDWAEIAVLGRRGATYPFRAASPWRALVERPAAEAPVVVYTARRYRAAASRLLARSPSLLP
ncbi:MAG: HD domain-containing protein [Thermoplasmata archaeon]